jgi:hypothetical protein
MAEFISSLDQIKMLRRSMGNPATGDVSDTALAQYIWLAECDLALMYEFAELRSYEDISTVAGTIDYELTEDDVLRFLQPANNLTANLEMDMMDEDWDRKIGSRLVGGGQAFWFFENGRGANDNKQVRIRPTPTGAETIRIPFILTPTMPDTDEATRSDLPVSSTNQIIARATEIGLQLIGERGEADAQANLSGTANYAARHGLPKAAFYRNRLATFQQRMNVPRRGRRRRRG